MMLISAVRYRCIVFSNHDWLVSKIVG